ALRAALVEQAAELAGDEELGDGRQAIEERTYAKQLERDDDCAPGGAVGVLDRAERGDRIERPHEPVAERGVLDQGEQDRCGHGRAAPAAPRGRAGGEA